MKLESKQWRRDMQSPDVPRANSNGDGRRRRRKKPAAVLDLPIEPNCCVKNPARQYSDHCYHDDDKMTVCCWCGFRVNQRRPGPKCGPHLPEVKS